MHQFTDGGLDNVWLLNGFEIRNTPHGDGVIIHHLDELIREVCLALARSPAALSGIEFRYLRAAGLKQSQAGLAQLLGNDEQSVARWEKTGKIPAWADKMLRVFYLGFADGESTVASAVHTINAIERATHEKLVFREQGARWLAQRQSEVSTPAPCSPPTSAARSA
ncbi:MAG: hypothetical protein KGJ64_04375 [Betaproteobacteria bacterium]|nr:hypothetical protein [Betaproteobacteria bacterium]